MFFKVNGIATPSMTSVMIERLQKKAGQGSFSFDEELVKNVAGVAYAGQLYVNLTVQSF